MNSGQGSEVYRINDLAKIVKVWKQLAILKYFSPWHMDKHAPGDAVGEMRPRGEKVHSGTMTFAGRSDPVYGDQSANGQRRLGYVIGPMASALLG